MQLLVLLDQRQQLALAASQQVDFVEDEVNFRRRMLQHLDGEFIALIELARGIHDQKNKIAAFQRLAHLDHHFAAERTVGLVYAWRIDQDDLRRVATLGLGKVDDTLNAIACGLRLRRDDSQLLAHESIEQGGLAGVGTTENADKTRTERHRSGLRASASGLRQDRRLKSPFRLYQAVAVLKPESRGPKPTSYQLQLPRLHRGDSHALYFAISRLQNFEAQAVVIYSFAALRDVSRQFADQSRHGSRFFSFRLRAK